MDYKVLKQKAIEVRQKFREMENNRYGKSWEREDVAQGLVGDVGDLSKLVQAGKGIRGIDDWEGKMAHELADILWSVLVLADEYGVDLEGEFMKDMEEILIRLRGEK